MTRKDYELIAHIARDVCIEDRPAIQRFCERMAVEFAQDNPRFDTPRFLFACGFKP